MIQQQSLVLFDGVCNLCNRSIDFILKRDKKQEFRYIALQSDEGIHWVQKLEIPCETDSVIFIDGDKVYTESDAAIEIGKHLPFPWNWFVVFKIIPKNWRDGIYRWIAKNRYRWFGKRATCRII